MKESFFIPTQRALERITTTFDLIHPVTISVWNMKCEVLGLKSVYPSVTETQLSSRYNIANNVHGVNYKRFFIDQTWDSFEEHLAWIILNDVISNFEGWLSEIEANVFNSSHVKMNTKAMQFPVSTSRHDGITDEINKLTSVRSNLLEDAFFNFYRNKKHRATVPISNLLYCYRLFKEMRNCYMHNGVYANKALINAYTDFLPFSNCADLGINEVPLYDVPLMNKKISLKLRGVIGFSEIILKIILTCDAELLCSKSVEDYFLSILHEAIDSNHNKILSSDASKAQKQVNSLLRKCGFVEPQNPQDVQVFLITNGIFTR